jgi:hypothetical protein
MAHAVKIFKVHRKTTHRFQLRVDFDLDVVHHVILMISAEPTPRSTRPAAPLPGSAPSEPPSRKPTPKPPTKANYTPVAKPRVRAVCIDLWPAPDIGLLHPPEP